MEEIRQVRDAWISRRRVRPSFATFTAPEANAGSLTPKAHTPAESSNSPARVSALDWRNADGTPHSIRTNTGKVSDDGKTITWDNGRIWKALDRSDWSAALTPDGKIGLQTVISCSAKQ